MSIHAGYFDESGTHASSKVIVVAGFVSDVPGWDRFSVEWAGLMKEFGLEYFHMNKFANGAPPYKTWSEELRQERINRLLETIGKYEMSSVGYAIVKSQYESVLSPLAHEVYKTPYVLAAMACFHTLATTAIGVDTWMDYTLEDGAYGKGALLDMYDSKDDSGRLNMNNLRISDLAFRDKRYNPPLQAADILAYELYKHLPKSLGWEQQHIRYPLQQLHSGKLTEWHYMGEKELRYWDTNFRLPAPSEGQ